MNDNKPTYELWFLGDRFNSRIKSRESLEALLKEAHECLQHAVDAKLVVGGVEIVEVSPDGRIVDSVWSMNVDELGRGYSQNEEVIHNGLR